MQIRSLLIIYFIDLSSIFDKYTYLIICKKEDVYFLIDFFILNILFF